MRKRWTPWPVAVLVSLVLGLLGPAPAGAAAGVRGVWPASGPVVRGFDPPAVRWGSGHRGVDLGVGAGTVIVAPRAGIVTYAAVLAGRPVLVMSHGETRTTFEPVEATVPVGTVVARGQAVGRLVPGHACPAVSCLHWGLRRGEQYLNPLSLVGGEVRLLSDAAAARIRGAG